MLIDQPLPFIEEYVAALNQAIVTCNPQKRLPRFQQKRLSFCVMAVDRYGRIVGMVYVGDTCVNEAIIKAGYAWVFRKYCKKPFCFQRIEMNNV